MFRIISLLMFWTNVLLCLSVLSWVSLCDEGMESVCHSLYDNGMPGHVTGVTVVGGGQGLPGPCQIESQPEPGVYCLLARRFSDSPGMTVSSNPYLVPRHNSHRIMSAGLGWCPPPPPKKKKKNKNKNENVWQNILCQFSRPKLEKLFLSEPKFCDEKYSRDARWATLHTGTDSAGGAWRDGDPQSSSRYICERILPFLLPRPGYDCQL